jgi:regulator of protease activity HflC (stomatin/prohibitin superfamily)
MDVVPVVRQVVSLEQQMIQTGEGKTIVVDGVIVYAIEDLYTFCVENHDAEENMAELAQAGVRKAVLSTPFAEINAGRAKFDNKLTAEAQKSLSGFGVAIESMRLQSCTEGQVHIHAGAAVTIGLAASSE